MGYFIGSYDKHFDTDIRYVRADIVEAEREDDEALIQKLVEVLAGSYIHMTNPDYETVLVRAIERLGNERE